MADLPNSVEELRARLCALKEREAKLEADLAIREFPELEQGITIVVLALADVKKLDKNVNLQKAASAAQKNVAGHLEKQKGFVVAKIASLKEQLAKMKNAALDMQLKMYEDKLLFIDKELAGTEKPLSTRFEGIQDAKSLALAKFALTYAEWEERFSKHSVKMTELLPSIADYLEEYQKTLPKPKEPT